MSLFWHPHVVPNDFIMLNTKYDFVECYKTFLATLDFYCMKKKILNFSKYVPQNKYIHTVYWINIQFIRTKQERRIQSLAD